MRKMYLRVNTINYLKPQNCVRIIISVRQEYFIG